MKTYPTKCSHGGCVQVSDSDPGFTFTSTIDGNDGAVTYTAAETANFIADVKAGKFDDLHRAARERDA
jgi:hypothetical protein